MSPVTPPKPSPFWTYLRSRLVELDMTMTELARRSGVKAQAIYKWHAAQPSVQSVRKVAGPLHEEPGKLLVIAGHVDATEIGVADTRPAAHDLEAAVRSYRPLTRAQKHTVLEVVRAFVALNAADKRAAKRQRRPPRADEAGVR